jgi:hypothetical protein
MLEEIVWYVWNLHECFVIKKNTLALDLMACFTMFAPIRVAWGGHFITQFQILEESPSFSSLSIFLVKIGGISYSNKLLWILFYEFYFTSMNVGLWTKKFWKFMS